MSAENPIFNSLYIEPLLHYDTDSDGGCDYTTIRNDQKKIKAVSAVTPTRQNGQKEGFDLNENSEVNIAHSKNLLPKRNPTWAYH
jgi:hypothetical protein